MLAIVAVLGACGGGGGGGGGADTQTSANTDSTISINNPTTLGRYETFEERIDLGGSSAVPDGADCSAPIVNNISGVNIRWRNAGEAVLRVVSSFMVWLSSGLRITRGSLAGPTLRILESVLALTVDS